MFSLTFIYTFVEDSNKVENNCDSRLKGFFCAFKRKKVKICE